MVIKVKKKKILSWQLHFSCISETQGEVRTITCLSEACGAESCKREVHCGGKLMEKYDQRVLPLSHLKILICALDRRQRVSVQIFLLIRKLCSFKLFYSSKSQERAWRMKCNYERAHQWFFLVGSKLKTKNKQRMKKRKTVFEKWQMITDLISVVKQL